MKLKYYLRGLGIGIIVSVIFFVVYTNNRDTSMTDDEIKTRARELGMIENTIISNPSQTGDSVDDSVSENINAETDITDKTDIINSTDTGDTTDSSESSEDQENDNAVNIPDSTDSVINTDSTDNTDNTVNTDISEAETVIIIIERGDSSYTAAKKLVDAGIIEDAKEFDQYLSQNGYDKKILTGSHEVPINGTYEALARAITSK